MLVHASVLRVHFPSPLACRVAGRQFLLPFDPARSKCIWYQPSNAPIVAELYNISDSSGWLLQLTDYDSKQASAQLWVCLRARTFSALNFLFPAIQCYLRGSHVKGSVPSTVVWKMLSEGTALLERRMLQYMWAD